MAQAVDIGVELAVTLATTVTKLTGSKVPFAKTLVLMESDVDVYVVTSKAASDGGALPSSGRKKIEAADMPMPVDITGAGFIGVAGTSAGTCRLELRQ